MSKRSFLILAIFVVTLGISFYAGVAVAHPPSPPICNDPVCNIDILDFEFNQSAVTIRPPNPATGESVMVVWYNHGNNLHSVTSGTGGSPDGIFDRDLLIGRTFQLNITQSIYDQILAKYPDGVLPYYCKYHYGSGMTAILVITGEPIPEFSLQTFALTVALISIVLLVMIVRYGKRKKFPVNSPLFVLCKV